MPVRVVMMISRSNTKCAKDTINRIAKRTSRVCPSSYVDDNDLSQTGWVGFIQAIKKQPSINNSFHPYAFIVIARAIRREGLSSIGILQAPHRIRREVAQVYVRLNDGEALGVILEDLDISDSEWVILKRLLNKHKFLGSSRHPSVEAHSDFLFILKDILGIPTLTNLEKRIILARVNNDQESLNMSRTTIWKHLQIIRSKLARGGYGS